MKNVKKCFGAKQLVMKKGYQTRKRQSIDPLYYAIYVNDDEDASDIERKFALLEKEMKENDTEPVEDIARKFFAKEATPSQVPTDVWFALEEVLSDQDDDEGYSPFNDEELESTSSTKPSRTYGHKKKARHLHSTLNSSTQVAHLGSGIDLWPSFKVQRIVCYQGLFPQRERANTETILSRESFIQSIKESKYHLIDDINAMSFRKIVGNQCDAIIMDPPFGHGGWNQNKLVKFLHELYPYLSRTFVVIWLDPDFVEMITSAFEKENYVFCDSVSVELLDELNKPFVIYSDKSGFPRESRMAAMYRTNDIIRSDLKQQRVKDTGYGVVYKNGKSYGRISMPLTVHNILQIMLPNRKNQNRVFVELWPSRFTRPTNWILIDEKEKPE